MGNSCAPDKHDKSTENVEREDSDRVEPSEQITKMINGYQAENEKLHRELEEMRNKDSGGAVEHEQKAKQNEEVMKELARLKAELERKDQALEIRRLEAALRSKATAMISTIDSTTRLCMEGALKHNYRSGLTRKNKAQWVELHLSAGKVKEDNYEAGYVMLNYADSKEARTSNRCQVIEVIFDDSDSKELAFSVKVSVEGSTKELVFVCETLEDRDEWVKCLRAALDEVKDTYNDMHDVFTLELEFSKEKIGIRVEECPVDIDHIEYDEKSKEQADALEGTMTKAARDYEIAKAKEMQYPDKVVKELEKADAEIVAKEDAEDEKKQAEGPCQLIVTKIDDKDLIAAGLEVKYKVKAINDIVLIGMVYSDQVELLQTTPKPYTLTFTGKNFLKQKAVPTHAYYSILKELVAEEANSVKKAFKQLVKGTPFEGELENSDDETATITALLSNHRRLMALLQNFTIQETEL